MNYRIGQLLQKFIAGMYRSQSLWALVLLFLFSTAIAPVVAEVTAQSSIVQSLNSSQLVDRAQKLYRLGQFQESANLWQQAATAFADRGDKLNQAMALSNQAISYHKIGELEKSKTAIQESLEILQSQPKSQNRQKILAQTLDIQAYLQRESGQFSDALITWEKSAAIYRQINDKDKLKQNQINQAQALQDLGMYPRACKVVLGTLAEEMAVRDCRELSRLSPEELNLKLQKSVQKYPNLRLAIELRSLGEIVQVVGQLNQSKSILTTSLELTKKLKLPEEQAASYLSLGNALQAIAEKEGDVLTQREGREEALKAYQQAENLSASPLIKQQARLDRLAVLLKREKYQEAEKVWRSLLLELPNLPLGRTGIYARINFAQTFIKFSRKANVKLPANIQLPTVNELDQILINAIAQAGILGDKRAEAYALGSRGGLYELSGTNQNLSEAETSTRQALSITSTLESADISYQLFWQLGRIHHAKGEIEEAIAAYTKAFESLRSLRGDLVAINPEVQYDFRDSVEPVYRQLVDLDFKLASSLKTAGKTAESQKLLQQASDVMESLQIAELNNFFREACAPTSTKQIDEIDRQAAVIYPMILPDRLEVLLILPDRTRRFATTQIPQQQLEDKLEAIQRSLLNDDSLVEGFLPAYREVYDWLIRPFESELAANNIKTLVFVPDGGFRNIPPAVLHDGKQYLIEKYAIAVTPGLQLLNPRPIQDVSFKGIAAGLSKSRQGFAELKNVPDELAQLKTIGLSVEEPLLDEKFTNSALKQRIAAVRLPVVHLATHAQFSSNPDNTFILTWDRAIDVKDLDVLVRDESLRSIPIELFVLSACQTATGDKRAALGLAGIAVRAGARTTVGTLWSVADESTSIAMSKFYDGLATAKATGINRAEALRQAQLTLLKDEKLSQKFSHPYFWAPFILVGNWR
jgi:CHAT domain-containing protein